MRVVRQTTAPLQLPRALAGTGLALALLIAGAFAAIGVYDSTQHGASRATSDASLTMADTFGLGGLPSLRAPNPHGEPLPSPVRSNEIVAYYGAPGTPSMGILGEHDPEALAYLLEARAATYRYLTGSWRVLPALHIVYGVAQPAAGAASMRYIDDLTVRRYIDLARRHGFVTILDLQIGHSDALTEVRRIEPYLRDPDVFVALDPEFALPGETNPGQNIGSMSAADVNRVQGYLAQLTEQQHLPAKTLIVHQFEAYMLPDATAIERRSDVDLVIDMDGYGPAGVKEAKYETYAAAPYASFPGIKVFLQHDPDPLSEASLLSLQPRPAYVVYQ